MVLVKRADERGFCFFTNAESRKGTELQTNPRAALCFHWKTLRRQVRVEGRVTEMEAADVDAYFHSRSRNSQIGAAVSQQSRPLASREELEARFRRFAQEHPGEVPRPPLLVRLLRACRADRVLDAWGGPAARPVLIYPRLRWMEQNPAVSVSARIADVATSNQARAVTLVLSPTAVDD